MYDDEREWDTYKIPNIESSLNLGIVVDEFFDAIIPKAFLDKIFHVR